MKRRRRILAGILCGMFAALLVISGVFVTTHLHHECSDAHCPVCAALAFCGRLLRGLALVALLAGFTLAGQRCARVHPHAPAGGVPADTLVTLKVKLSD